jgi:hypothetical protein
MSAISLSVTNGAVSIQSVWSMQYAGSTANCAEADAHWFTSANVQRSPVAGYNVKGVSVVGSVCSQSPTKSPSENPSAAPSHTPIPTFAPSAKCLSTPQLYAPQIINAPAKWPGITLSSLDEIEIGTAEGILIYFTPGTILSPCLSTQPSSPNTPTSRDYIFWSLVPGGAQAVVVNFAVIANELWVKMYSYSTPIGAASWTTNTPPTTCALVNSMWTSKFSAEAGTVSASGGYNANNFRIKKTGACPLPSFVPSAAPFNPTFAPSAACRTTPQLYAPKITNTPVKWPGVTLSSLDEIEIGTAEGTPIYFIAGTILSPCLSTQPSSPNTPTSRDYIFWSLVPGGAQAVVVNFAVIANELWVKMYSYSTPIGAASWTTNTPPTTCALVNSMWTSKYPAEAGNAGYQANNFRIKTAGACPLPSFVPSFAPVTLPPSMAPTPCFNVFHAKSGIGSGVFTDFTVSSLSDIRVGRAITTG